MFKKMLAVAVLVLFTAVQGLAQSAGAIQALFDPDQMAYQYAILDAQANLAHAKLPPLAPAVWDINAANPNLIWKGTPGASPVLTATFTRAAYYPETGVTIPAGTDLWVTPAPEMRMEIKAGAAGDYAANPGLAASKYLGLPPVNANNAVVELWVDPASMLRPAISASIDNHGAETEFPVTLQVIPTTNTLLIPKTSPGPGYGPATNYISWFLERESSIYTTPGASYPWTGLGYTYNWADPVNPVGGSEFVIPKGSPVTVKSVTPIGGLLQVGLPLHLAQLPLGLAPAGVEDGLGVAVGLDAPREHQVQGGLEGHAGVVVRGHGPVGRVPGVLAVHHLGHAPHGLPDLVPGADPVVQPVGQVLAGDAQGGPVLHEAHVMDVGHLGAADALLHPARPRSPGCPGQLLSSSLWMASGLRAGAASRGDGPAGRRGRPGACPAAPAGGLVHVGTAW